MRCISIYCKAVFKLHLVYSKFEDVCQLIINHILHEYEHKLN